jgi:DNA-directed RNA polymerase beta' subunit
MPIDIESKNKREREILQNANNVSNVGTNVVDDALSKSNNLKIMAMSEAKGTKAMIGQMTMRVGMQTLYGQRLEPVLNEGRRSSPYSFLGSNRLQDRGYVESSFIKGLKLDEYLYHNTGSREGLIDTSKKTGEVGDDRRRLMKSLEDLHIDQDGSVRNRFDVIYQPVFGYHGLWPRNMQVIDSAYGKLTTFIDLGSLVPSLNRMYSVED